MKKIAIIVISALVACQFASAQGAQFLDICSDAALLGTAGAGSVVVSDAYSSINNPATMSFVDGHMAASAGYLHWQPEYAADNMYSAAVNLHAGKRFSFAADFRDMAHAPYDIVTSDGKIKGSFSPMEISAGAALSYRISSSFSLGVRAAFVSSSLAESAKGKAFCADLGLAYRSGSLAAGLAVCNLGSSIDYGASSVSLPLAVKAGASYGLFGCMTILAEADYQIDGGIMVAAGLEYCPIKQLALRAGYHYGDARKAMPSFVSAGLGVKLFGVNLDAAYLFSSTLGGSLSLCLGYAF